MTFDPSACHQIALANHGGGCCGISHIYSFPPRFERKSAGPRYLTNAEDAEMRIRYLIGKYWADSGRTLDDEKNRLYEAVLQSSQRAIWEPILERIGFRLVMDFKNTNSGNRVFVYHYAMGPANEGGVYVSPYKPDKPSLIVNPFKAQPRDAGRVVY